MVEPLSSQVVHYILAGIFAILAFYLRKAVRKLGEQEHTRVKANLSFDYVVKQEPEYKTMYNAMFKRNGGGD